MIYWKTPTGRRAPPLQEITKNSNTYNACRQNRLFCHPSTPTADESCLRVTSARGKNPRFHAWRLNSCTNCRTVGIWGNPWNGSSISSGTRTRLMWMRRELPDKHMQMYLRFITNSWGTCTNVQSRTLWLEGNITELIYSTIPEMPSPCIRELY